MTNMEYEALKVGALLHDIGKFTKEFLEAGLGSGNPTTSHSIKFFEKIKKYTAPFSEITLKTC